MIETLFFDTDCISAFLWVRNESLVTKMYPGRVVIPKQVYIELSHPGISHLKERLDTLLLNNQVRVEEIQTGTEAYAVYYKLTIMPGNGHAIIGAGEAAAIALAKTNNGIVASNNLKDVMKEIDKVATVKS